ncbi:IS630 family transposase [Bacteroidia bacterium]|nr:IS630 family transposase [Bacteroidia bacterium]
MRYELSPTDIETLHRYQRNVRGKEYIKVTSILMLAKGYSPESVSECLGIDTSTVYRYRSLYTDVGLDTFLENRHKGYWGMLSSTQLSQLQTELKFHIYTDSKSVALWIQSQFGVTYTSEGVVDLLNRIGFTYKKTKEVPCECDADKQESFASELSELFENLDEKSVVYYADGVHPTHNSRSTYAWIEKGQELEQPTVSGRDRVNINGIINAKDVTDMIAIDCQSVNAESTKELYQKALERHPQAEKIYIISDNARYYKNKELTKWIEGTKIVRLFLPPYSPNLNLIERLWRFLRKKVINTHFYRTKELFRQAIGNFFENIAEYKTELQTLLTLNFRLCNSHSISF